MHTTSKAHLQSNPNPSFNQALTTEQILHTFQIQKIEKNWEEINQGNWVAQTAIGPERWDAFRSKEREWCDESIHPEAWEVHLCSLLTAYIYIYIYIYALDNNDVCTQRMLLQELQLEQQRSNQHRYMAT